MFPKQPSQPDMVFMSIWLCPSVSPMLPLTSCTLWTRYSCRNLTSSSWFSLTTFWSIPRMRWNMNDICVLFFNTSEIINCMRNFPSVNSGWTQSNFWVTPYPGKASQLTPAKYKKWWPRNLPLQFIRFAVFSAWWDITADLFRTSPELQNPWQNY